VGIDYVLVDINDQVLAAAGRSGATTLRGSFGGGHGPAPDVPLGIGDVLQITIFEKTPGGGTLFIPQDSDRSGNFVTLPAQVVDRSGTVTVPYAGRVKVAGRSIPRVQQDIERLLVDKAVDPQVVINLIESRSSQISVLGDVNAPQKLDINPGGERVLDMIARAGGVSTPGIETYVTLQRRGHEGTILFDALINTPSENIYVAPGDIILVNRERRTYLAFGASGVNGRIGFEDADLTLAEAVAKAGGLLDERANPAQVFLYRVVDRKLATAMGIDLNNRPERQIPIIFRVNLRDPGGFFAAQNFAMRDKDILYIANAHANEILKFLSFITSLTGSSAVVTSDAVETRDAIRDLGH
jgi:polysaccharide export outer membrane protein